MRVVKLFGDPNPSDLNLLSTYTLKRLILNTFKEKGCNSEGTIAALRPTLSSFSRIL